MTLKAFDFPPGFDKHSTAYAAERRWFDGDKVRESGGKIETMGGWVRIPQDSIFEGICRGLHAWFDNDSRPHLGVGTDRRLYQMSRISPQNITPIVSSGTLNNVISTVNASNVVTVDHPDHKLTTGTYVRLYDQQTVVEGITLDGWYEATVTDAYCYTVVAGTTATGDATLQGGELSYEYELSRGLESDTVTAGFGLGLFGGGLFGGPRTHDRAILPARTWSMVNSGEDLVANPRGGGIYVWQNSSGGRATQLQGAPQTANAIFITDQGHLFALDPDGERMRLERSDPNDITCWQAAATNEAGGIFLEGGSQFLAGTQLREGTYLVWSDEVCFRLAYLGQTPWFSYFGQGENTGLLAPRAFVNLQGTAYWMADRTFYMYDTSVREMPNVEEIRNHVFDNLNGQKLSAIYAFSIVAEREVWFVYPSAGSDECDRYVMHSLRHDVWYTGTIDRSAGIDANVYPFPRQAGRDGYVYDHENGEDDVQGSTILPIEKRVITGMFDLDQGQKAMDVHGVISDVEGQVGDIQFNIYTRMYPNEDPVLDDSALITETSTREDLRASGRQAQFEWISNSLGGKFVQGKPRLDIDPSGGERR